jgi:hypothetical protein
MRGHLTDNDETCAHALGWASLGIGLTELVAPDHVQDLLGLEVTEEQRGVIQVLGAREVLHGISILANGCPTKLMTGVWSRVAGDVLDTALLAVAGAKTRSPVAFAAVSAMVLAIGAADTVCALRLTKSHS